MVIIKAHQSSAAVRDNKIPVFIFGSCSESSEKLSWAQQKEEQARQRKAANDLRKCEEKIASAEEQIASLEEKMAMPENYSDPEKFGELARQKEQLEEELALLYEQWEELSENAE